MEKIFFVADLLSVKNVDSILRKEKASLEKKLTVRSFISRKVIQNDR